MNYMDVSTEGTHFFQTTSLPVARCCASAEIAASATRATQLQSPHQYSRSVAEIIKHCGSRRRRVIAGICCLIALFVKPACGQDQELGRANVLFDVQLDRLRESPFFRILKIENLVSVEQ